jgi:hypothetical protein
VLCHDIRVRRASDDENRYRVDLQHRRDSFITSMGEKTWNSADQAQMDNNLCGITFRVPGVYI